MARRRGRAKKIAGAYLWLVEKYDESFACAECKKNELQEGRGCGFTGHQDNGIYWVGENKKKHTYRHQFTQCPMSILCDYKLELAFEMDWQALGRPPVDYDDCGYRFWSRVKTMHGESEYHRNSYTGD